MRLSEYMQALKAKSWFSGMPLSTSSSTWPSLAQRPSLKKLLTISFEPERLLKMAWK